eukprot:Em0006g1383a
MTNLLISSKIRFKEADRYFYYGVRIVTGSEFEAGTMDNDLYVTLVGSKACTGKINISGFLSSPIATKSYVDLLIQCKSDLGEVLVVSLGNPKNWITMPGSEWFVDFVDIIDQQTKKTVRFPCYHWIADGDSIGFTSKTAILKDVMPNSILVRQRQSVIDQRRLKYKWQAFPKIGLPSAIDVSSLNLPSDEQFGVVKGIDFTKDGIASAVILEFTAVFTYIDSLSQFEQLAKAMGKPEFPTYELSRWMRDEEFGRQMLNGVNPMVIERCATLPPNFPVTSSMVKSSMDSGLSLEDEMKAGHIYICNLKMMDGLPLRDCFYSSAPLCLLYVNKANQLVPIAIQLKQEPGSDNPIFLPTDSWADWTLAKMYYQCAHAQFHQIVTHYLSCHAVMETYGMGIMRNLPDAHPVYRLLRPHFRYTMAINARARETLINDGGIIDLVFAIGGEGRRELMRRSGAAYNIHWTNIKRNVKSRGVDDPNLLPGYYYRDDGLKLWQAMEDFVAKIINEFYSSDEDVKGDSELQNVASDLYTNGFPANGGEQGHGFPKSIDSREQLVELCTLMMFTGSAQHSSINFGQYDMYSYTPNATTGMRLPPPTTKGDANDDTLIRSLPDKHIAALVITMGYLLSKHSKDERFLVQFPTVQFPAERFTESKAQVEIVNFRKSLINLDADIVERNKPLDVPYVYMQPSRVTESITI